jgi:hypothetical protein
MKNCLTLFFISLALVIQAQSITIYQPGCFSNTVLNKIGTTAINGITRNTYQGGTPTIRVIYTSNAGGRWEIQLDVFTWITCYYNTTASAPLAPALGLGTWVSTGAVNGCNNLSIFSGTGTTTTVPIELTHFDAHTEGSKNHLTWRTASERDNKHFDIERSADGSTFHSIGQVKGNNKPSSYQFVDNQPFATSYYRLRQLDFDGTETFSKIVSVERRDAINRVSTKVYPNPVSSLLTIEVIARNEATEGPSFQIFNLLGQQVLNHATSATSSRFQTSTTLIDISALPQGTYILKVGAEQAKFVKQ